MSEDENTHQDEFRRRVDEFAEMEIDLHNEVVGARDLAERPVGAFTENSARRQLFRSCFAHIEGVLFAFKQILLHYDDLQQFLKCEERSFMQEIEFYLSGKEIDERPAFIRLAQNIQVTFAIWGRIDPTKTLPPASYDTSEWSALLESIRVRNRVTHPKRKTDLDISDHELQRLFEGFNWFKEAMICVVDPLRTLAALLFVNQDTSDPLDD